MSKFTTANTRIGAFSTGQQSTRKPSQPRMENGLVVIEVEPSMLPALITGISSVHENGQRHTGCTNLAAALVILDSKQQPGWGEGFVQDDDDEDMVVSPAVYEPDDHEPNGNVSGSESIIRSKLITELQGRHRHRKFIWAGYIVKTILPGLGAEPWEAQTILDNMVKDNVIRLEKRHNPRNPEFPTTEAILNLDHPEVKRASKGLLEPTN